MRDGLEGYSGEGRLTLQVAAQIIERISSGLYRSPESALKELVSNAFDADSPDVWIRFFFDYKEGGSVRLHRITVTDHGSGMDVDTLKYIFTHVGGSRKETESTVSDPLTPGGRPMIGRLGVGMLSIASACEVFMVRTKKRGQNREFLAEVDLSYLRDKTKRTQSMDVFTIGNVGLFSKSVSNTYDQYTIVDISRFTFPFMESIQTRLDESFVFQNGQVLEVKRNGENEIEFETYFKKLMDWTINGGMLGFGKSRHNTGKLQNAHSLDAAVLNLGLMSPVQYLSDGPVKPKVTVGEKEYTIPGAESQTLINIKNRYKEYNFGVYIEVYREEGTNKEPAINSRFKVFKPILYPTDSDLNRFGFESLQPEVYVIDPVEAKIPIDEEITDTTLLSGYYYHQHKRILPHEYRGILFRVYNVAIGTRFQDDLKLYVTSSVMLWQSVCELYLDKGFQRIVNLDRESLYEGNNVFRHLRNFLENYLAGNIPLKLDVGGNAILSPVERKFFSVELEVLKKNPGLINIIKGKRTESKKEEREEPWDRFEEELLSSQDCEELIIDRTEDIDLIALRKVGKTLQANLPRLRGDRMWDAIFLKTCLELPAGDKKLRKKIFSGLLNIYSEWVE